MSDEIINLKHNLEHEEARQEQRRQYYRRYFRLRYQTDEEYKKTIQTKMLSRYHAIKVPKTISCQQCQKFKRISRMEKIGYQFNRDNFLCEACNPINCPNEQLKFRGNRNK